MGTVGSNPTVSAIPPRGAPLERLRPAIPRLVRVKSARQAAHGPAIMPAPACPVVTVPSA
jgi:hypothetical protein